MSGTPYYTVAVHPDNWKPPKSLTSHSASGPTFSQVHADVVSLKPWQHSNFIIGGVSVIGRKSWGASNPVWQNEVIYYNTKFKPLSSTLYRIVIHHTNNSDPINAVERNQKVKTMPHWATISLLKKMAQAMKVDRWKSWVAMPGQVSLADQGMILIGAPSA